MMSIKKILFVHHVSHIGGGSFCLLNLLKEVERDKYEPIVLLQGDGPLVNEIHKLGIKVMFMSSLRTIPYNQSLFKYSSISTYWSVYHSQKHFQKILCEIQPDILYLNNTMLYPYLLTAHRYGVRTIIHIREHWPLDEHKIQLYVLSSYINKYADHLVAINKFSSSMVPKSNAKTTIIYDWIDFTNRDRPIDLNILSGEDLSDKKVFLYTGGMQNIKGTCEVFETFSKICDQNCRLIALGAERTINYSGVRGFLKRLLALCGIKANSVRIYDALLRDSRIICSPPTYNIKSLLEQCYCVLSYFTIPHANLVLAESIISKTPIIAARTPESEEYSHNGEYAALFDFKKIDQFERVLADIDNWLPSLKQKLIKSGAEETALMFDKKVNVEKFKNVLSEVSALIDSMNKK